MVRGHFGSASLYAGGVEEEEEEGKKKRKVFGCQNQSHGRQVGCEESER